MIDVLIPVFNARATVREAVSNILRQSVADFRVVLVDDGSFDGTSEILAELAASDPRIVLIRKENGGIVSALNFGLSHCKAEFVARHDADDLAYPTRLATQLEYLIANPDCVAVGANAWHIDIDGRHIGRTRLAGEPPADWSAVPSVEPYMMHPFLLARRRAVEKVGGYREVYNAEDTDLYWRLREHGRLYNLPDIMGEYRIHTGGVTSGSAIGARINAVMSQLAAISARRARAGIADLSFDAGTLARYRQVSSFRSVLATATEQLTPDKAGWLLIAASAKLLELRSYREFRLSMSDIFTVTSIFTRGIGRMSLRDHLSIGHRIAHRLRPKFRHQALDRPFEGAVDIVARLT